MRAQTAGVGIVPNNRPPHSKLQAGGLSSYALPEDTGSIGSPIKLQADVPKDEQSSYLSVDEDAKKHILNRQGLKELAKKRKIDRMLLQIASGQKVDNPYVIEPNMDEEKLEILRLAAFEKNFSSSASKIHGSPHDNVWNNPMWRDTKRCKFMNPKHGILFQEHMLKKQLQKVKSNLEFQTFENTSSSGFGPFRQSLNSQFSSKPAPNTEASPGPKNYRLQSFFTKAKEAQNLFAFDGSAGKSRPNKTELDTSEASLKNEKAIQLQSQYLDRLAKSDEAYLELAVGSKMKGEAKGSSNTILLDVSSNSGFTHGNKQVKFAHKRIKSESELKDNPKHIFEMLCDVSNQETYAAREPHLLLYESIRNGRYPASSKGLRSTQGSATNLRETNSIFRRSSNGAVFRSTTQSGNFAIHASPKPSRSTPSSPPRTATKSSAPTLKLTTSASFFPGAHPQTPNPKPPTVPSSPSLHTLSRAAHPPHPTTPTLTRMQTHLSATLTNNSFHPLDFLAIHTRTDLKDLYSRSSVVKHYFEAKLHERLKKYPTKRVRANKRPDLELDALWHERREMVQEVCDAADELNRAEVFREEVERLDWEREVREVLGGGIETVSMNLEKRSRNLRNGERLVELAARK